MSQQLQGVCTEGIGLRAVAHARALYLHEAFLGLTSDHLIHDGFYSESI